MEHELESHSSRALELIQKSAYEYDESDFKFYQNGFVKYCAHGSSIFVGDIYVEQEFRGTPVASMILEQFTDYLNSTDALFVYGYVMKYDRRTQKRLETFKKWGLSVLSEKDNFYVIGCPIKELKGNQDV